jgi:hypothetical protein
MKHWIAAAALVAVGSLQMVGDLSGWPQLKAAGAITHASPAPKVFTSQGGFETFSSRFFIDWTDVQGQQHALELTPRSYRDLQGPYNRRNAYGAALSYGPVLAANERTRPMFDSVMRHSFCGSAPLLRELGIPSGELVYPVHIRLEPREQKSRAPDWQTEFSVQCQTNP